MAEQTKPNETRFEVEYHHRYDLRKWIRENFPWVEHSKGGNYNPNDLIVLERRAGEIVDACTLVEQIDLRNHSAYIEYYSGDWKRIKDAAAKKDFQNLAYALDDLLGGIDWE